MNDPIDFNEFPPVSDKAWKQLIQADLKGGDYNELLTWTSPEGITVKPFYSESDITKSPEESPNSQSAGYQVGYAFDLSSEKATALVETNLENGVEALVVRTLSENIEKLNRLRSYGASQLWDLPVCDLKLVDALKSAATPTTQCLFDPIHGFAASGNWAKSEKADLESLGSLAAEEELNATLSIHADLYQNAGANRVQELGYALAHGHEYLLQARVDERLKTLLEEPVFHISMGSEYFFEIAKIRALRRLWELLGREYGFSGRCKIIAHPTLRNKTIYDYNTNMLRTTTECMAGVLGGADLICNLPYDSLYHDHNDFADRIARNQLLLLKHESYFSSVSNPADGSYYIESLTDQLGERALELFKSIEKGGGFLSQLREHTIQNKIEESAQREQQAFDAGNLVLVGSNTHPNPEDKMKEALEKDPFRPLRKIQTQVAPILAKRLSETQERKRLENEQI